MAAAAVAAVSYVTGLTGTAAVVATTAIATVAATATASALLTKKGIGKNQGQLNRLDLASNSPRRLQIGKRGNGGKMVFATSHGHKNSYAEIVIYLGEGPMGRITGIWSSGRKVFNGTISHGQRVQLSEFDSPDGRAWVEYFDGRPGQTASSRLAGLTSKWSNADVGTGCAYVVLTCRWDPDTMPAIPSMFFETEGAKLYDRRKDDTAGGSGSHRIYDPSTWELSDNPAVALDHYLLGRYLTVLDAQPVFGVGLHPSLVSYQRFATMANICDEAVAITKTTQFSIEQPRYGANGFIFSDEPYKDVILDLCRAMNARAADLGGEIGVVDNEAKSVVLDLTDDDIYEGATEVYVPKKSRDQLIGGIRGNYQDPANNYNPVDYPAVTDPSWQTTDGEALEYGDFDLDFETDPERAQRLALLHARRERRQATLTGVYGMKAVLLEDGDWITRTGARFPAGKTFEVIGSPVLDTSTMSVKLDLIEVDISDAAWVAATDPVAVNLPEAPESTFASKLTPPVFTATPDEQSVGDTVKFPIVRLTNTEFDPDETLRADILFEIYLRDGDDNPVGDPMTVLLARNRNSVSSPMLLPETNYTVRGLSFLGERISEWSDYVQFTSTANLTAQASADQVLTDALTTAEEAREQIAELIISLQVRLEDALGNLADRGRIDGVKVGTKIRSVQQEIVDGDKALAYNLEVVKAQSEEADASIIEQQTAIADQVSAEAEKLELIEVRVDNAEAKDAELRTAFVDADEALSTRIFQNTSRLVAVERGTEGQANVLQGVVTDVRRNEHSLTALSQEVTALNAVISAGNDTVAGQAGAVTALTARVVSVEGSMTTFSQQVENLTGQVAGLNSGYGAISDALTVIQNAINDAGGSISVDLQEITSLSQEVTELATGIAANNNRIDANVLRINSIDGSLEATNQSVSEISTRVGDQEATLTALAQTVAESDASAVEYALRGVAGESFFEFYAVATGNAPSVIHLKADQIVLDGQVILPDTVTATQLSNNATTDRGRWNGPGVDLPSDGSWVNMISGNIPNELSEEVEFRFDCDFARLQDAGLQWRLVINSNPLNWRNILAHGPNLTQEEGFEYFTCQDEAPFILQMRVSPPQSGARVTGLRARSLVNKN